MARQGFRAVDGKRFDWATASLLTSAWRGAHFWGSLGLEPSLRPVVPRDAQRSKKYGIGSKSYRGSENTMGVFLLAGLDLGLARDPLGRAVSG